MGVGRGIVFPNDSVWRLQPPDIKEMVELWKGNSGLSVPPLMMRTGVYGMGADGSVWEYAPTAANGMTQLFNGKNLPVITGISPSSGSTGTSVTITGSGFTGATTVNFGSTNATSFTVNSDSSITAVSPAIAPGTINITVTTAGGTSIAGAPSQFTGLITPTTWNPSDKTASVTLSNNNLTASTTASPGAGRGIAGFSSGKYYWEAVYTTVVQFNGGVGLSPAGALPSGMDSSGSMGVGGSYHIYINGADYLGIALAGSGNLVCFAVDLGAQLFWSRLGASGNWNNSGTANPATGTGGISISALSRPLFPMFAVTSGASQNLTANFGASSFTGTVPSGFAAGWG